MHLPEPHVNGFCFPEVSSWAKTYKRSASKYVCLCLCIGDGGACGQNFIRDGSRGLRLGTDSSLLPRTLHIVGAQGLLLV